MSNSTCLSEFLYHYKVDKTEFLTYAYTENKIHYNKDNHFSSTKVNAILKQLEQLNINPVTIAKNRKFQKLDDIFQILVENEILFNSFSLL